MKEIKFRAWDIENKKMIYDVQNVASNEKYNFMQFTGVNDKNNRDIYDGDIINLTCSDIRYGKIDVKCEPVVWMPKFPAWNFVPILYRNTCHRMSIEEFGSSECDESYIQPEFEVIGNIYENPELLREWPSLRKE